MAAVCQIICWCCVNRKREGTAGLEDGSASLLASRRCATTKRNCCLVGALEIGNVMIFREAGGCGGPGFTACLGIAALRRHFMLPRCHRCIICTCRKREGAAGLEDGTASFLGIAALRHGFAAIERAGGFPAIDAHTSALTR